jgi:hypothetical protein
VPQWLCLEVFAAQLRMKESDANLIFDFRWKTSHRLQRVRDPDQRLRCGLGRSFHPISSYAIYGINGKQKVPRLSGLHHHHDLAA